MSDVTIPEDVRRDAIAALDAYRSATGVSLLVSFEDQVGALSVAILAEREACAAHLEALVARREEAGIKRAKDHILACAAYIRQRGSQAIRSSHD